MSCQRALHSPIAEGTFEAMTTCPNVRSVTEIDLAAAADRLAAWREQHPALDPKLAHQELLCRRRRQHAQRVAEAQQRLLDGSTPGEAEGAAP
jgi:hypothetical protein